MFLFIFWNYCLLIVFLWTSIILFFVFLLFFLWFIWVYYYFHFINNVIWFFFSNYNFVFHLKTPLSLVSLSHRNILYCLSRQTQRFSILKDALEVPWHSSINQSLTLVTSAISSADKLVESGLDLFENENDIPQWHLKREHTSRRQNMTQSWGLLVDTEVSKGSEGTLRNRGYHY